MLLLILFFVGLPVALFVGFSAGVQWERDSLPDALRAACFVLFGLTLVIDVLAQWTVLSLYFWELPHAGEYTFSKRLERLVLDAGWRGRVARPLSRLLNWIAPLPHIKNILEDTAHG